MERDREIGLEREIGERGVERKQRGWGWRELVRIERGTRCGERIYF